MFLFCPPEVESLTTPLGIQLKNKYVLSLVFMIYLIDCVLNSNNYSTIHLINVPLHIHAISIHSGSQERG